MKWFAVAGLAACAASAAGLAVWLRDTAPDAASIQSAYEHELGRGSVKHDPGLHVRTADCNAAAPRSYICSIQFTSAADRDDRLYLDIVQVNRADTGWTLKSGLCRS